MHENDSFDSIFTLHGKKKKGVIIKKIYKIWVKLIK